MVHVRAPTPCGRCPDHIRRQIGMRRRELGRHLEAFSFGRAKGRRFAYLLYQYSIVRSMPADDALFAPDAATLTAIRDRRLRATLDCVFRAHPFYRRLFERAGIAREDISGIADLGRL